MLRLLASTETPRRSPRLRATPSRVAHDQPGGRQVTGHLSRGAADVERVVEGRPVAALAGQLECFAAEPARLLEVESLGVGGVQP